MKALRYLMYRIYQLMISVGNRNDAVFTTVIVMAMTAGLNIAAISAFIYVFLGEKIGFLFGSRVLLIIEYIILCITFYFMFAHKRKYLGIEKEFEQEKNKNRVIDKFIAIVYIILSIGLVFFSFYLMIIKNRGR